MSIDSLRMTQAFAAGFMIDAVDVDDVIAILGRRGRGKTTTAVVMVEELHRMRHRFCVVDPTGVWWGLKSSRDGRQAGIPCIVMGGEHHDVPLAATSGEVIADFVTDSSNPSCVLDLRAFSQADMVRFMTAFLARLYHKNRDPLHLVLDEADQFAPQRPAKGEEAMLGSAQRIVKMGRAKGLHPVLITQRPATLNKNVLTQAGMLIAHATTGPQDRAAIDEWVKINAKDDQREVFLMELATMPRGAAYFWSPDVPFFEKVTVRDRTTFDSSATPKRGEQRREPKKIAEVDLDKLRSKITATIEAVKANDPGELRKLLTAEKLAHQKTAKQFADMQAHADLEKRAGKVTRVTRVETPVLAKRDQQNLSKLLQLATSLDEQFRYLTKEAMKAGQQAEHVTEGIRQLTEKIEVAAARPHNVSPSPNLANFVIRKVNAPKSPKVEVPEGVNADTVKLKKGAREILATLVARDPTPMSRAQVAMLAGIKPTGSTITSYLSNLRQGQYIAEQGDLLNASEHGINYFGDNRPTAIRSIEDMVAIWNRRLKKGAREILDYVMARAPHAVTREDLSTNLNIDGNGSTMTSYLSNLRIAGLIEDAGSGSIRFSTELAAVTG